MELEFDGQKVSIPAKSIEHAYQMSKCVYELDARRISDCDTPGKAKRLGKQVKIKENWDSIKLDVMESLLRKKFDPELNPPYAARLKATGNAVLQEGNAWGDTFWGVNAETGEGQNHLGCLIMKIRKEQFGY